MTRFHFRLDSVLAWRKAQLEAAEFRLRQALEAAARVEAEIAAIEVSRMEAEREVRAADAVTASDLWALSAWREALRGRAASLAARLRECEAETLRRREEAALARRRCRLLERLRERRLAEWDYEQSRELDNFASDAYLARWNAR